MQAEESAAGHRSGVFHGFSNEVRKAPLLQLSLLRGPAVWIYECAVGGVGLHGQRNNTAVASFCKARMRRKKKVSLSRNTRYFIKIKLKSTWSQTRQLTSILHFLHHFDTSELPAICLFLCFFGGLGSFDGALLRKCVLKDVSSFSPACRVNPHTGSLEECKRRGEQRPLRGPGCQEKAEAMLDLVLLCCWSVGLGQGQELPVQTLCLRSLKLLHSRTLCSLPPRKI